MKHIFILIGLLFSAFIVGQEDQSIYQQASTFYPNSEEINEQNIEWGFFIVPENWHSPSDKKIKLAVAILKSTSNNKNADAVVMIEGGPGAGAIEGIWWWLNHPLRETHDIVLVDTRGAGFSEPRLCPELGKEFLSILAKNQSFLKDEEEKAEAAIKCQQNLIAKGIDINNYHSQSIAQDLHSIKEYLKYSKWSVYGVSYGTYIAQTYVKTYPGDVKTLILDSPISTISEYYTLNTSNYVKSLEKVFKACKEDPKCNSEYPELESVYYKTIAELKESPVTVKVDKETIPSEEFTYNAEDFKIAVHQALYKKKLIEILPLLIYQFHERNEDTLSALVAAFSGAVGLDYGVYYCMTCNETIPKNSFDAYNKDVKDQKLLSAGISFYKSDFVVCDLWNKKREFISKKEDTLLQKINVPTLIFTGSYDPITPSGNGKELSNIIENAQLIEAATYGHASSFSRIGFQTVTDFIKNPNIKAQNNFNSIKTFFVKDIHINGGISKMGNSLNNLDILFFIPLTIALLISFIAIFVYLFTFLRRKKQSKLNNIVRLLLTATSLTSILIIVGLLEGLNNIASKNFYILAFGLTDDYSIFFNLLNPFIVFLIITSLVFFLGIKKINNRSLLFTVLFSNILTYVYLIYWNIF